MAESNRISRRYLLKAGAASALSLSWGASSPLAGSAQTVKMKSGHRARLPAGGQVEIKPHQGRTSIFVDGKPIPGMSYYGRGSEKVRRDVADTSMPVFFIRAGPLWNGPGRYDVSPFENGARKLGDKVKDVWLIPRLNCIGTPGPPGRRAGTRTS
jgi:hypothetical protein